MDYGYGYVRRGSKSMYNSRIMNCALCFSFGATSVSHIPDTLPRSFQISAEFFLFSTNLMCLELIAREQKSQVGKIWKLSKTMICSSSDIWNCGDCWYGRFWMGAHNAGAKKVCQGLRGAFCCCWKSKIVENPQSTSLYLNNHLSISFLWSMYVTWCLLFKTVFQSGDFISSSPCMTYVLNTFLNALASLGVGLVAESVDRSFSFENFSPVSTHHLHLLVSLSPCSLQV